MGLELQRSEGRAVTGRSSYPVQRAALCESSTRASPIISTVPAAVPDPAHNCATENIHCWNGLSNNVRDRSARSLLEKELRHVGPEDGELQFIVPAPAQVRTSHSLSCNLHWECEITATKLDTIRSGSPIDRKNVRQHLSFGFGIHRYVPRVVTVDTNHKPFSSEQGVTIADVPDRSHRSCAIRRGTARARCRIRSATEPRRRPQFG